MAFNETLAARVRQFLAEYEPAEEIRMMGGLCFMYKDKMLTGVVNDELMCRVDPERIPELIETPGCRQMEMGGRAMKGYVLVDETALLRPQDFRHWMELALAYNERAKSSRKRAKS